MNAPEPPSLSPRVRGWLIGLVLINIAAQLAVGLSGLEPPEPIERSFAVLFAVLGFVSLALVMFLLKVDRRAVGLTLGEPTSTLVRTSQQLLILAAVATLYTAAIVAAARWGRLKIPVAPTSMTDPHTMWDFCILAVLVGPMYEEFLFRGVAVSALQGPLRSWIAIVVSATLFSVPHYISGRGLAPFVGPFILGLFLAWSFLRTRSVLTPFLVHAAFNSGVILKDYLMAYHPGLVRHVLSYH